VSCGRRGAVRAGVVSDVTGVVELYAAGADLPPGIETFLMLQAFLTTEQRGDPAMVELASATWITEDHLSELARIEAPVLVIANEHDPAFPPIGQRAVAEALPNGTYFETPGVSHISIDPDSIQAPMKALVEFLAHR